MLEAHRAVSQQEERRRSGGSPSSYHWWCFFEIYALAIPTYSFVSRVYLCRYDYIMPSCMIWIFGVRNGIYLGKHHLQQNGDMACSRILGRASSIICKIAVTKTRTAHDIHLDYTPSDPLSITCAICGGYVSASVKFFFQRSALPSFRSTIWSSNTSGCPILARR